MEDKIIEEFLENIPNKPFEDDVDLIVVDEVGSFKDIDNNKLIKQMKEYRKEK